MADADLSSQGTSSVALQEFDEAESSKDCHKLEFSDDEASLVARMFRLVGQRWSLIAGRIPGRTPEEIEKYWTSRYTISEQ